MATPTAGTGPSLLPMFARAAVETAAAPVLGRIGLGRHGDALPERSVVLGGQRIDTTRLGAYDRVCGFRLSGEVPSTYLHVLAFPLAVSVMTARGFPLPLVGMVHVGNVIVQHRPVGVSETVEFEVHAADLRAHRSGRQVDLVASASVDGEAVWSSTSTYLHRTASGSGGGRGPAEAPDPSPGLVVRVPGDTGRRYAAVSGDRNPIHLHPLSARLFGFPKAIAHGMWLAARTLSTLEGRLAGSYTYDVQFKAPVLLPTTVEIATRATSGGWDVEVHGRSSGRTHLVATVR